MTFSPEPRWPVPDNWAWTKLSRVGDIVAGGTPSTKVSAYWGDEIPWISPADLTGYAAKKIRKGAKSISRTGLANSSAKLMPAGSVHFSSRAPIGYIVISSEPMATNQGFKSLVPAPGIVADFAYYYLMASREYARQRASGTTFLELSGKAFGNLSVPVAPTAQQRRIVAKIEELFSELDKGVENLEKVREQLKVYRQAVLKHAFEGKLTAQWREENKDRLDNSKQLLARIKRERTAHYARQLKGWEDAVEAWEKNGQLGKKPTRPRKPKYPDRLTSSTHDPSWACLALGELAREAVLGKMLDREKNTGISKPYLGNINLRWGRFVLENLKVIKVEKNEMQRYSLTKGDLVICEGGEPGRCAVWESAEQTIVIQKALHRVRFTESYNSYFAFYFMMYAAHSGLLSPHFTGSTIKHLTGKGLRKVLFPICTLAEQERIVNLLNSAVAHCDKLERLIEKEVRQSDLLRQSILQKAFSGELVAQDPDDEPASALLERIKAEKAPQTYNAKLRNKRRRANITA